MSYYSIVIFFVLALSHLWVHAQESFVVPVDLILTSEEFDLNSHADHPHPKAVFVPRREARVRVLDEQNLQFTFRSPVRVPIFDPITGDVVSERVFQNFYVQTSAEQVELVARLRENDFIITGASTNESMQAYIDANNNGDYDPLISQLVGHHFLPNIYQFKALHFALGIESLGQRQAYVEYMKYIARSPLLPFEEYNPSRETNEIMRRFETIYEVYSPQDSFVRSYQAALGRLVERMGELRRRGWLRAFRTHRATEAPPTFAEVDVIDLNSYRSCQSVFVQ
jgi:hypothetical protein